MIPQKRQVEGDISVICYRVMPVSISAAGSIYDGVSVTGTSVHRNNARMIERRKGNTVQMAA